MQKDQLSMGEKLLKIRETETEKQTKIQIGK